MRSWDIACWVNEVAFASLASVTRRLNCVKGRQEGKREVERRERGREERGR